MNVYVVAEMGMDLSCYGRRGEVGGMFRLRMYLCTEASLSL